MFDGWSETVLLEQGAHPVEVDLLRLASLHGTHQGGRDTGRGADATVTACFHAFRHQTVVANQIASVGKAAGKALKLIRVTGAVLDSCKMWVPAETIQNLVSPDLWVAMGGTEASINITGNTMFITGPAETHAGAEWVLQTLIADLESERIAYLEQTERRNAQRQAEAEANRVRREQLGRPKPRNR